MTKKQTKSTKPTWLYDKSGNVRIIQPPVNGRGEKISIIPQQHNGKIPDSVGFSGFKK